MTPEQARLKRKWSVTEAARRMGIGHQSLLNLERGRVCGAELRLRTVLRMMSAYWPDVRFGDLDGAEEMAQALDQQLDRVA